MQATSLTLLSPGAALLGLPALSVATAVALGHRRAEHARRALRLPPPPPRRLRTRLALALLVAATLALAAAQPVLLREQRLRVRSDAQALFVVDVSRSMAAADSPRAPTRLARASAAAIRLRRSIPDVSAGIATLTDRVLPDLLPVADARGFDRVLWPGLALESPPPRDTATRATAYDALAAIPGGGFFRPGTRRRIVVVLTDGESAPVGTSGLARAFAAHGGTGIVFVRFWGADEAIWGADGTRESAYRPDPAGAAVLGSLAPALRGGLYGESELAGAAKALRRLVGTGARHEERGVVEARTPIAPYLIGLSVLAAAALLASAGERVPWRGR